MIHNNSRYIGLFIGNKKSLWKALRQLTSSSASGSWLYITVENPPKKLKSLLKRKSIPVKQGQILLSSEFKLREQVVRAKPVIEALEEKVRTMGSHDLMIFIEMPCTNRAS